MKLLTLFLFLLLISTSLQFPYRVRNFWIKKCGNQVINLQNVDVHTNKNKDLLFSGTLSSQIDLDVPISLALSVKRNLWGMWIPVPCVKNVGSCKFSDLCRYGKEENDVCPTVLSDNNLPCRCPIAAGNYTIPEKISLFEDGYENVIYGKYIGKATLYHKNKNLGCFNFKFVLY